MFTRVKKKNKKKWGLTKQNATLTNKQKKQNNLLVVSSCSVMTNKQTNMHILQSAAGPQLEGDGGVPQHSNQRLV